MTRRKRGRRGRSYTAKPHDLRDHGVPGGPVLSSGGYQAAHALGRHVVVRDVAGGWWWHCYDRSEWDGPHLGGVEAADCLGRHAGSGCRAPDEDGFAVWPASASDVLGRALRARLAARGGPERS